MALHTKKTVTDKRAQERREFQLDWLRRISALDVDHALAELNSQ